MKASLFTLVALLVFYVHADAYARCFERIAVYYAYQIDQLRPSDDRKIAVNCATARKIAKCNFIQLLEHIDGRNPGDYNDAEQILDNPNNNAFDVRTIGDRMNERGWGNVDIEPSRVVLPDMGQSYFAMLNHLGKSTGDTVGGLPASVKGSNYNLIEGFVNALDEADSVRRSTMSDFLLEAMRQDQRRPSTAAAPAQMQGIVVKTYTDAWARAHYDSARTLDAPENSNIPDRRIRVTSFVEEYNDPAGTLGEAHRTHKAVTDQYDKCRWQYEKRCG